MPAERAIAEGYLVSRTTVRQALAHLEADGLISRSTSTRSGRVIVPKRSRADTATATGRVVVLTPSLRDSPLVLEQLAILRDLLGRSGVQVTVREAARLTALKKVDTSLARLAASHPGAVWILHKMPRQVQAAAARLRLPALIFGSAFGDVDLPSIDVDFRAVARHAGGRCLARGHRHLRVIVHRTPLAGDELIVEALAVELARREAPPPLVMKHDFHRSRLTDALDQRIIPPAARPDALLIVNQHHLLTALPHLLHRGLRIPGELSLVYLSNDPAAERLSPLPDRYNLSERLLRRLATAAQARLAGELPPSALLLPRMLPGETMG